ncbi:MAG: hypothetical protein IJV98_05705 [Clostridia bacterium]|nr:hypothetical protein [Clostridia bacterium]
MEVKTKTYFGRLRPIALMLTMLVAALCAALSIEAERLLFGVVSLIVMGGVFTALFLITQTNVYMVIGASGGVCLLQMIGGFPASLAGVGFILAAFILAHCVRQHKPKIVALVSMALTLGTVVLLSAAVLYAVRGGSLAPADLLEKYQAFFHEMKIAYSVPVHEMVDGMDAELLALYAKAGVSREMLLETYLESMEASVDAIQLAMPGIIAFLFQLVAYFEIAAFRICARICRVDALLPALRWHIYPTQVSCIVYLIVSVLYMIGSFFSSQDSVFLMMTANFWLILLPMMLLCGVHVLVMRLQHPLYRTGTGIMLLAFVFGFFFLRSVAFQLAFFVLSFLGAQTAWTQRTIEAEKMKKNQEE